jgi:glucokinase
MSARVIEAAPAIALDIGATAIKIAAISRQGELLAVRRIGTPSSPEPTIAAALDEIRGLANEVDLDPASVTGIGCSIAAYELGERLSATLPANYYFALDAPAPTLGEAYFGAGRGCRDFAYVTVSTGVGAGLFLNGAIYTGGLGWAGGVGHVIVDPEGERVCAGCGNRGCLETYAATQGILALAWESIQRHPESLLARIAPAELTPRAISDAALQGDAAARCVFDTAGRYLGLGLTNLVDITSVQRIVIGGGVALAGDLLLEPAREVVRQRAFPPDHRKVEIVPAALGDLSGVYGAAAMVFNDIRINIESGN